jgi:hypothetical protein
MWPIAFVGAFLIAVVAFSAYRESRRPVPSRVNAWIRASLAGLLLWSPYTWLLLIRGDDSYRRHWLELWPALPGLPAVLIARSLGVSGNAEWVLAAMLTLSIFAAAVLLSGRSKRWMIATAACLVVYGALLGRVSFALFSM